MATTTRKINGKMITIYESSITGHRWNVRQDGRYGRYINVRVEELELGMVPDHGRPVVARTEAYLPGTTEVNPRTWSVWFSDGLCYTETRGATIRVWIDEGVN